MNASTNKKIGSTIFVGIRLNQELLDDLKIECLESDKSLSEVIRIRLQKGKLFFGKGDYNAS